MEYIVLTGSEAVSRSIVDAIRTTAAASPGFMRSVPLNKDDESRVDAIEKELIKLGSEVCMCVCMLRYVCVCVCMLNSCQRHLRKWEGSFSNF